MIHIVYVSTVVQPMGDEELKDLLRLCRDCNERNQITGMMLYKNGHFMQVIEGDKAPVTQLMDNILRDLRHHNIDIMRRENIPSRDFPDWTMGFQNISASDRFKIPGFTNILESDFNTESFSEDTSQAHQLLLAFKEFSDSHILM